MFDTRECKHTRNEKHFYISIQSSHCKLIFFTKDDCRLYFLNLRARVLHIMVHNFGKRMHKSCMKSRHKDVHRPLFSDLRCGFCFIVSIDVHLAKAFPLGWEPSVQLVLLDGICTSFEPTISVWDNSLLGYKCRQRLNRQLLWNLQSLFQPSEPALNVVWKFSTRCHGVQSSNN